MKIMKNKYVKYITVLDFEVGRIFQYKSKNFENSDDYDDIDFIKNPLYISQNCIRHHLFRNQAYDIHYAKDSTLEKVLASITGLIRGYVVPASQCKRTSPLLIEDFVDQ